MVGILQIMTYLLCIYLVFKGVEIFQIGLANERYRVVGVVIGVVAILIAVTAAVGFAIWVDLQATSIQQSMPTFPRP